MYRLILSKTNKKDKYYILLIEVRVKTSIKYVTHVNIYIQKGRKNYLNSLYYECSNKYMWIFERIDG